MDKGKVMASRTNLETQKQIFHRPFVIRKTIVLTAIALAVVGGVLFGNLVLGIAFYFGFVTFFDGISHFVLHLKSSDFSNPEELLKSEKVTGQELDYYFDTRRSIRLISFGIASTALAITLGASLYPLEVFCISYILSTLAGILYVRFFVNIKRPRLMYRDDRYYVPRPRPRPGYITPEQYALRSVGIYFYGPVDI